VREVIGLGNFLMKFWKGLMLMLLDNYKIGFCMRRDRSVEVIIYAK